MKVKDIMSKKLVTIGPETTIREIVHLLIKKAISSVPVVDREMNLQGLVTAEILIAQGKAQREGIAKKTGFHLNPQAFVKEQKQIYGSTAKDIMIHHVVTASENIDLFELVALMEKTKASRMPVVRGIKVVGFVSRHDLLKGILALDEEKEESEEEVPLTDDEITRRVIEGLKKNLGLSLMNVRITTRGGMVRLQGQVDRLEDLKAAAEIAASIPGVKSVDNSLLVDRMLD
ncbi:MAG: CBS domain-containing protein [bacterium]